MEETIRNESCAVFWQFPRQIVEGILVILLGMALFTGYAFPKTIEGFPGGQQITETEHEDIIGGKIKAEEPDRGNAALGEVGKLNLRNPLLEGNSAPKMLFTEEDIPDKTLVLPDVSDGDVWEAIQQDAPSASAGDGALERNVKENVRENVKENAALGQSGPSDQTGTENGIINQAVSENLPEDFMEAELPVPETPFEAGTAVNPVVPEPPFVGNVSVEPSVPETSSGNGAAVNPSVPENPSEDGTIMDSAVSGTPSAGDTAVEPLVPGIPSGGEAAMDPSAPGIPSGDGAAMEPSAPEIPSGDGAAMEPTVPDTPSGGEAAVEPTVPDTPSGGEAAVEPTVPDTSSGGEAAVEPTVPDTPSGGEAAIDPSVPDTPSGGEAAVDPAVPDAGGEENDGEKEPVSCFLLDEMGMLYGFLPEYAEITDGCLTLPPECTGIRSGAFSGCGAGILELYIPAGAVTIEDGALADLVSLEWIDVEDGNAGCVSDSGVLFDTTMSVLLAFPAAWLDIYSVPPCVTKIADRAFDGTSIYKLDIRGCTDLSFGENVFGNSGGSGIQVVVTESEMEMYAERLAGYAVTLTK